MEKFFVYGARRTGEIIGAIPASDLPTPPGSKTGVEGGYSFAVVGAENASRAREAVTRAQRGLHFASKPSAHAIA